MTCNVTLKHEMLKNTFLVPLQPYIVVVDLNLTNVHNAYWDSFIWTDKTDGQTNRQTDKWMDRQTNGWTDRRTDRVNRYRQTDKVNKYRKSINFCKLFHFVNL